MIDSWVESNHETKIDANRKPVRDKKTRVRIDIDR